STSPRFLHGSSDPNQHHSRQPTTESPSMSRNPIPSSGCAFRRSSDRHPAARIRGGRGPAELKKNAPPGGGNAGRSVDAPESGLLEFLASPNGSVLGRGVAAVATFIVESDVPAVIPVVADAGT